MLIMNFGKSVKMGYRRDILRSLQSWVSTLYPVELTADLYFIILYKMIMTFIMERSPRRGITRLNRKEKQKNFSNICAEVINSAERTHSQTRNPDWTSFPVSLRTPSPVLGTNHLQLDRVVCPQIRTAVLKWLPYIYRTVIPFWT